MEFMLCMLSRHHATVCAACPVSACNHLFATAPSSMADEGAAQQIHDRCDQPARAWGGPGLASCAHSGSCCRYVAELQSNAASRAPWDVLFYGDSIMESWRCALMNVAPCALRINPSIHSAYALRSENQVALQQTLYISPPACSVLGASPSFL